MADILGSNWPLMLLFAAAVAMAGGVVKGVVGFAMPMVLISGLSSIAPPDVALAGVILPTLFSNGWQGLRQGPGAALGSLARFKVFLIAGLIFMLCSAQLVAVMSQSVMLLIIGIPIVIYAAFSLAGRPLRLPPRPGWRIEAGIGAVAGFFGGISGVWGPPTVLYLTAIDAAKDRAIAMQGVVYGAGAVVLLLSHLRSGILNADTMPLSIAMVVPMIAGVWIGQRVQDRLDQRRFRRAMLVVLVIVALNLIRRGLADMGFAT